MTCKRALQHAYVPKFCNQCRRRKEREELVATPVDDRRVKRFFREHHAIWVYGRIGATEFVTGSANQRIFYKDFLVSQQWRMFIDER